MTSGILEGGLASGYWGERTSSLDWCEENWVVTPMIAEFWNALSNGIFIVLGLMGWFECRKWMSSKSVSHRRQQVDHHQQQHRHHHDHEHQPPFDGGRFQFAFATFTLVGIGSLLFHGTLKYHMQLVRMGSVFLWELIRLCLPLSFSHSSTTMI